MVSSTGATRSTSPHASQQSVQTAKKKGKRRKAKVKAENLSVQTNVGAGSSLDQVIGGKIQGLPKKTRKTDFTDRYYGYLPSKFSEPSGETVDVDPILDKDARKITSTSIPELVESSRIGISFFQTGQPQEDLGSTYIGQKAVFEHKEKQVASLFGQFLKELGIDDLEEENPSKIKEVINLAKENNNHIVKNFIKSNLLLGKNIDHCMRLQEAIEGDLERKEDGTFYDSIRDEHFHANAETYTENLHGMLKTTQKILDDFSDTSSETPVPNQKFQQAIDSLKEKQRQKAQSELNKGPTLDQEIKELSGQIKEMEEGQSKFTKKQETQKKARGREIEALQAKLRTLKLQKSGKKDEPRAETPQVSSDSVQKEAPSFISMIESKVGTTTAKGKEVQHNQDEYASIKDYTYNGKNYRCVPYPAEATMKEFDDLTMIKEGLEQSSVASTYSYKQGDQIGQIQYNAGSQGDFFFHQSSPLLLTKGSLTHITTTEDPERHKIHAFETENGEKLVRLDPVHEYQISTPLLEEILLHNHGEYSKMAKGTVTERNPFIESIPLHVKQGQVPETWIPCDERESEQTLWLHGIIDGIEEKNQTNRYTHKTIFLSEQEPQEQFKRDGLLWSINKLGDENECQIKKHF